MESNPAAPSKILLGSFHDIVTFDTDSTNKIGVLENKNKAAPGTRDSLHKGQILKSFMKRIIVKMLRLPTLSKN